MPPWDDLHGDMARYPFDNATIDRLLTGSMAPDVAPPRLRHLAELVGQARQRAQGAEIPGREAAAAAFAAAIRMDGGTHQPRRIRAMLGKYTKAKIVAIAAPVVLLSAGAAAAATGSLPAPAQHAVSTALSHVDISVPDSNSNGTGNAGAKGPDASPTGHATFGLCTAYAAGGLNSHGVAYRNLAAAAASTAGATPAAKITAYCAPIIAAHAANGSSNDNSSNQSSGGGTTGSGSDNTNQGGAPFTTPPVSTPAKGKPTTVPPVHP